MFYKLLNKDGRTFFQDKMTKIKTKTSHVDKIRKYVETQRYNTQLPFLVLVILILSFSIIVTPKKLTSPNYPFIVLGFFLLNNHYSEADPGFKAPRFSMMTSRNEY